MSVTIDPDRIKNTSEMKLQVLPDEKSFRINKIQTDLRRGFSESIVGRKAAEYGMGYINLFGYPITSLALSFFTNYVLVISLER